MKAAIRLLVLALALNASFAMACENESCKKGDHAEKHSKKCDCSKNKKSGAKKLSEETAPQAK